jgi:hypothetical protein
MAERLPRPRPGLDRITEALTQDKPVTAPLVHAPRAPASKPQLSEKEWNVVFGKFLERVMAQAAIGGDAKPLQAELEALLEVAPPGKREELEKNRGKPPTTPTSSTPKS